MNMMANVKIVNPCNPLGLGYSILGRYLAHNRLSLVEKAFIGADLVTGDQVLVNPTQLQAAMLARVNPTYVFWALQEEAQFNRHRIEAGKIPLMPSRGHKHNGSSPESVTHALPAPTAFTDSELVELAHHVGAERWLAAGSAAGL